METREAKGGLGLNSTAGLSPHKWELLQETSESCQPHTHLYPAHLSPRIVVGKGIPALDSGSSLVGSKTERHTVGRESGIEGGSPQSSGQKRCRPAHLRLAPRAGH